MSPRLGVVAAMAMEARALAGPGVASGLAPGSTVELQGGVLLARSGIGPRRARRAAEVLVMQGAGCLASWGVAGGLDPDLRPGDLILPGVIRVERGSDEPVDKTWRERVAQALGGAARGGTLLESSRVIARAADKIRLFQETGAVAVDMESGAVAAVARQSGLPFLALRAVCDAAQTSLPPAALVAVDEEGRASPLSLIRSLLRSPGQIGRLLACRRDAHAAFATLDLAARRMGHDLSAPGQP